MLLLVAAGLLLYALRGMNVGYIISQVFSANIFWVLVSGLISIIAFVVRAHRWNLLIEPMGYSPTLKNTTYSVMVGYFANLALPRLGEVSRCGALSKAESIPFNKLLGTVIIERIIDVICLLICILLAAAIEFKRLGNFFQQKVFGPLNEKVQQVIGSPVLLAVIILVLVILLFAAIYFIRKSKGSESKISKILKGFIDGLRSVANLKRPWLFIFQSAFIWVLYYLGVYTALFCIPFYKRARRQCSAVSTCRRGHRNVGSCAGWNWSLPFICITRPGIIWSSGRKRACICVYVTWTSINTGNYFGYSFPVPVIFRWQKEAGWSYIGKNLNIAGYS